MNKSKIETIRLFFFFAMIVATGWALIMVPRITLPLMISYVFYLIIHPVMPALMKLGLSKIVAILVIFLGIGSLSVFPVVKMVPAIAKEAENFQYYIPKMENYLKANYKKIKVKIKDRTGFEIGDKLIYDFLDYGKKTTTQYVLTIPKYLASILEWFFLVPLFVFFFLKDGNAFKRLVLKATPNSIFERFYYLSHQFNRKIGDYIFAKFIEATIVGVLITTGLAIMGVRFSVLFGLIAGVTNVIPYLGPVLGMVPGIIFCLAEYDVGTMTTGVVILYLVANAIDMGLVFPILVSKIVDLHPIIVVISVILGSQYFGIAGMVISIPFAAAVKLVFEEVYTELYSTRSR